MSTLNNHSVSPEIFTTVRQIGTFFYVDSTGQLLLVPGKSNADTMTLSEIVQTLSSVPSETQGNHPLNTETLLRRITFVAFGIISLFIVNRKIANVGCFTALQYWMYIGLAGVIGLYAGAVTTDCMSSKIGSALVAAKGSLLEVQWLDRRMAGVLIWRCLRDILSTLFITVIVLASFGVFSIGTTDATTFFSSNQPSFLNAIFDVIGMWLLWVCWHRSPILQRCRIIKAVWSRLHSGGSHSDGIDKK